MQGYTTVNFLLKVALGQSIGEGTLQLKVIHGFIEQIKLGKNRWREGLQIATTFPLLKGKPLYLKHLEQGIDQLDDKKRGG